MNLNQEIKLGDLFKNAKKKSAKKASSANKRANDRRPKKLDVVGLKIGASQLAAAHVVNNGSAKLVEVAREPLEPGIVVAGEVRDMTRLADALDGFFSRNKLPRK